jgi:hypothetical protein
MHINRNAVIWVMMTTTFDQAHTDRCKRIASAIESISQTETEELFRIIHKHHFDYTRNNHGVFINLTWVPEPILKEMEEYIRFCHQSKHELKKYESICDALNTKLVCSSNETQKNKQEARLLAKAALQAEDAAAPVVQAEKSSKVSSSMRFYLMKKKFSKMVAPVTNLENDLNHDNYVIST